VDAPTAHSAVGYVFAWTARRSAVPLRGHQVLAFRAGRCFAVTLTARPEQFDQLRPEFEAILGSFRFLDALPPASPG
jgi:hypothetical protein